MRAEQAYIDTLNHRTEVRPFGDMFRIEYTANGHWYATSEAHPERDKVQRTLDRRAARKGWKTVEEHAEALRKRQEEQGENYILPRRHRTASEVYLRPR